MPYVSDAQRRFFHSDGARKAGITAAMVQEYDEASRGKELPEAVEKQATFVMYTLGKMAAKANALGAVPKVFKPAQAIKPPSALLHPKTPRLPSTPPSAPKGSGSPGLPPPTPFAPAATSSRPSAGPSSSGPAMGGPTMNEPLGGGAASPMGPQKALDEGAKLTSTTPKSTPYV